MVNGYHPVYGVLRTELHPLDVLPPVRENLFFHTLIMPAWGCCAQTSAFLCPPANTTTSWSSSGGSTLCPLPGYHLVLSVLRTELCPFRALQSLRRHLGTALVRACCRKPARLHVLDWTGARNKALGLFTQAEIRGEMRCCVGQ